MKRVLSIVLCLMLMLGTVKADRSPSYEIQLYTLPLYGQNSIIAGEVRIMLAEYTMSDYVVKAFVRPDDNGQWYAKPTYETPYVNIEDDGFFLLGYATGENDSVAKTVTLMIVANEYKDIIDFDEADAISLYTLTIDRYPSGVTDVKTSLRNKTADNSPSNRGINVGFYTREGSRAGEPLDILHIRKVLGAACALADTLRFYSCTGPLAPAYDIAAEMGFKVAATAWLNGSENDIAEMDALIELCNSGKACLAVVGNEAVHSGSLTAEQLVKDILYVRERINDSSIPVTTAETTEVYDNYPSIAEACDAVGANIYPFWEGMHVDYAKDSLEDAIVNLQGFGKPVIVTETGWPTDGAKWASVDNMNQYIRNTDTVCRELDVQYFWFSLADEGWKADDEGPAGAHWGYLTNELNFKRDKYWVEMIDAFYQHLADNNNV